MLTHALMNVQNQIEGFFKVLKFYDISGQIGQNYTKMGLKIKRKLRSKIVCDGSLLSHKGGFTCFIDHSSWMRGGALCADLWQLKMSTHTAKVVLATLVCVIIIMCFFTKATLPRDPETRGHVDQESRSVLLDPLLDIYDVGLQSRLEPLILKKTLSRDPDLIRIVRDMIVWPNTNPLLKIDNTRVVLTPQFKEVDRILHHKVGCLHAHTFILQLGCTSCGLLLPFMVNLLLKDNNYLNGEILIL